MADVPSFCPKCGNTILPGHTFCFKCGARRYEPAATATVTHDSSTPGEPEGPTAGTPSTAAPSPSSTKPPSFVEGPPSDTLVPRETAQCSNCGAVVDVRSETCWSCGVAFEAGVVPASEAPPVPSPTARPDRIEPERQSRISGVQRSRLRLACLLIGLALLLASLVVGWYAISADTTGSSDGGTFTLSGSATYYLLDKYVQSISCSGAHCPPATTTTGTYPGSSGNAIANLYGVVSGLVIAALAVGAAVLVLGLSRRIRAARWAKSLILLAVVLVAVAPLTLVVAQPSALSSTYATPSGGASPGTSFFGSCSGSTCGASSGSGTVVNAVWGPSVGWFLCFVAAVPFLVGFFLSTTFPGKPSGSRLYDLPR